MYVQWEQLGWGFEEVRREAWGVLQLPPPAAQHPQQGQGSEGSCAPKLCSPSVTPQDACAWRPGGPAAGPGHLVGVGQGLPAQ